MTNYQRTRNSLSAASRAELDPLRLNDLNALNRFVQRGDRAHPSTKLRVIGSGLATTIIDVRAELSRSMNGLKDFFSGLPLTRDLAPVRRHLQEDPLAWNQRIVDVEEYPEGLLLHFDLTIYERTEKQNPLQLSFKDVYRAIRLFSKASNAFGPDNHGYQSVRGKIFSKRRDTAFQWRFLFRPMLRTSTLALARNWRCPGIPPPGDGSAGHTFHAGCPSPAVART